MKGRREGWRRGKGGGGEKKRREEKRREERGEGRKGEGRRDDTLPEMYNKATTNNI